MIKKTALVIDRGERLSFASKLGEKLQKVWYYRPESSSYPTSPQAEIGFGVETVEKVNNFLKYAELADYLIYFDVYDGEDQEFYHRRKKKVFGGRRSADIELEKTLFIDLLDELNLNNPDYHLSHGISDALKFLEGKEDLYLKSVRNRGDFETYHYVNKLRAASWFDDLRAKTGRNAETIEILIQKTIKSVCEPGFDGFNVNGIIPDYCLVGYEDKDKNLMSKIFKETPEVLANINEAFAPFFKETGIQGHWTIESRITKEGEVFPLDPTVRSPSPSGELMQEIYPNYAEAVLDIAEGNVPDLGVYEDEDKKPIIYGAEIILKSHWHRDHELCVEIPKDCQRWVKLKNYTIRDGVHYCIPNGGAEFFGAVVGMGSTPKEAKDMATDIAKEIGADELEFCSDFSKAEEGIKEGINYGIVWEEENE